LINFYVKRSIEPQIEFSSFLVDNNLKDYCQTYVFRQEQPFDLFFNRNGDLNFDFYKIFRGMAHPSKSPGSPLCYVATNNDATDTHDSVIYTSVLSRLSNWKRLGSDVHNLITGAASDEEVKAILGYDCEPNPHLTQSLLANNYSDPVLLKVKGEPRVKGKKPRLVNMVSLMETTAVRVLAHNFLVTEQKQDKETYQTAVSLDITTPCETAKMFNRFSENSPLASSDVRGWEYANRSRHHWCDFMRLAYSMMLIEFTAEGYSINYGKENHFFTLLGYYFSSLFRATQSSDGKLFVFRLGTVVSGKLLTFSSNSFVRSFTSYEVSLITNQPFRFCLSAGDDNLDSNTKDSTDVYAQLGFEITDFALQTEQFNFCSTVFTSSGSYQENIEKFLANCLYSQDFWLERMTSFGICFGNHPQYAKALEFLYSIAPDLARD